MDSERRRIGIDLGGTKIEGLVLDQAGRELARKRIPTPSGDYAGTLSAIVELVRWLETSARSPGCSVGLGTPGALSPASGLLRNCNSTCLNGQPFVRDLEAALGRPVRIANDANCFALSEAIDGAAKGAEVVFGVIVGTGTGGGIVAGGRVLTGPNAIAGEWGHNPLPWPADGERPGPPCYCGKAGCIETFLSGPGLEGDLFRTTGRKLRAAAIVEAAAGGDRPCREALDRHADRFARSLATVLNVLDPDVVVLGGGISNIASLYDELPRIWGRYVFSDVVRTRLARNVHGDSSGVRGAAWLWE